MTNKYRGRLTKMQQCLNRLRMMMRMNNVRNAAQKSQAIGDLNTAAPDVTGDLAEVRRIDLRLVPLPLKFERKVSNEGFRTLIRRQIRVGDQNSQVSARVMRQEQTPIST